MDFDPSKPMFDVVDQGPEPTFHHDVGKGEVRAAFDCQPYAPLLVLKCFTKMALGLMPEDDLEHYRQARDWVLHRNHSLHSDHFESYK